jgi:adenine-specific DNA-methyltransferase
MKKSKVKFQKLDSKYLNAVLIPAPTEKDKTRTLLEKHLTTYVAKNTFDYFIHKDLKRFLKRELDFYIKSEVMKLDDIGTEKEERVESYLCKIRAIKSVGEIIIDFLAQIEDFQKKLWLKKKFVVETNWCITLDLIDEKFYPEIAANQKQIDEWIEYYKIDEIKNDDKQIKFDGIRQIPFSTPLTVEFLKQNKNLVLDTKYFDNDFKERLIESIDNLDERTNGLLIHSENFQALNLLQEKYKEKIQCIYIDPPYNTNASEIIYKNGYKHSSWLSLMENRLALSKKFNTEDGTTIIAIDKYEHTRLVELLRQLHPNNDIVSVAVEHNKKGTQGDHFSYSNEFAVFSISNELKKLNSKLLPEDEEYSDSRNLRDSGSESNRDRCMQIVFIRYMCKMIR